MPKPRMKLNVEIPDYPRPKSGNSKTGRGPGLGWRRQIHAAVLAKADAQELTYLRESKLDVSVLLFMTDRQVRHGHDLDNMTKHLLDALQGKLGGAGKTEQDHRAIVPSDAQVCRLAIEKRERKTKKEKSRMIVRAYRPSARRGLV
jgi:Holliday junction resolvase RusA-like endonuclease